MIEITNISLNVEPNTKHLRIDFRCKSEQPKKVVVKVYETFFNLGYRAIGGEITVHKDVLYWISDVFSNGLIYRINDEIRITFEDVDNNNNLIYQKVINIGNTNIRERSMGKDMSLNNIWFLSDSNGFHYFSKFGYGSEEYFFNNKVLMSIDVPELSINRFVNSNVDRFFKTLPLLSEDKIILNLGEIDCRVSFFRNSKLKKISLIENISNITDRYVEKIKGLQKNFEEIEFIVCLPHPTLKDGWLNEIDIKHLLDETKQTDRRFIREYFIRYLIQKLENNYIRYINPFISIEDNEGYLDNKFLLPFDNHTKSIDEVINELKKVL